MGKKLSLSRLLFIAAFFLGLVSTGILFNSQLKAQGVPNPPPEDQVQVKELICEAKDPATLQACFNEAKKPGTPIIKLIAPIECKSRQECQFDLSGVVDGGVLFTDDKNNKIIRSEDYGYTLFNSFGSSGWYFQDFIVEDQDTNPCPAGIVCPPLWSFSSSHNITIKNVTFNRSHGATIAFANSTSVHITGSKFNSSLKNAIEVSGTNAIEGIKIETNLFTNNAGNAIVFQGVSSANNPSIISKNQFTNNHAFGSYANPSACAYPCIGSQLKITGSTSNLKVEHNMISGGSQTVFDTVGLYTSGIEIGNQNISETVFSCNTISDNRGSAIVQSRPVRNSSNITIEKNKIFQNGLGVNVASATVAENNCYTADCKIECE